MTTISARHRTHIRMWLESPSPPHTDPPRVVRRCPECETWLIGVRKAEVIDRLAGHRERCHG